MTVAAPTSSLSEERGHAVILVTHDAEIAEKAHRSIRMQDGRLLEATLAQEHLSAEGLRMAGDSPVAQGDEPA